MGVVGVGFYLLSFLGASPDGVINDGAGIIEVKKVTSKEGESFE